MAKQDVVSYIKNVWNKVTNGDDKSKEDGLKELDEFLKSLEQGNGEIAKPTLPDAPKYDRVDYDAPTDEEIDKNAQSGLSDYKQNSVSAIEKEIENLKNKYDSDLSGAKEGYDSKSEAVEGAFGEAKKSNDNDMLKRGLARSSIAVNKNSALEGEKAKTKASLASQYQSEITRINGELNGLEGKRDKALNEFNISYAAKLTESINKLKNERDTKAAEALKYNNTLTQKEYDAAVDKTMKESDLYGEALSQHEKENALTGGKGTKDKSIYNKAAEVLRGMNPLDAQELLADNNFFKANLSDYYYYLLYDEFVR